MFYPGRLVIVLIAAQAGDAGVAPSRACSRGLMVTAMQAPAEPSPLSLADVATIAELEMLKRELRVLSPSEAKKVDRVPELLIRLHIATHKGVVFFVIRSELRETWPDHVRRPAAVIVWQAEEITGITDPENARDVLLYRVAQSAISALRECKAQ